MASAVKGIHSAGPLRILTCKCIIVYCSIPKMSIRKEKVSWGMWMSLPNPSISSRKETLTWPKRGQILFILCCSLEHWTPASVSAGASHQGKTFMMVFLCTAAMLCISCCWAAPSLFNTCLNLSIWLLTALGSFGLFRMVGFEDESHFPGIFACKQHCKGLGNPIRPSSWLLWAGILGWLGNFCGLFPPELAYNPNMFCQLWREMFWHLLVFPSAPPGPIGLCWCFVVSSLPQPGEPLPEHHQSCVVPISPFMRFYFLAFLTEEQRYCGSSAYRSEQYYTKYPCFMSQFIGEWLDSSVLSQRWCVLFPSCGERAAALYKWLTRLFALLPMLYPG